jgi:transcriptional regulator with XRE-family HTH domain
MGRPIRKRQATTRAEALGSVITDLRLEKGLSGQDVAEKVGTNHGHMTEVELGAANPTFSLLQAIADFHRIRLSRLIGMAEDKYARRPRTKS